MLKALYDRMFKRHATLGSVVIRRDLRPEREDAHGTIRVPSNVQRNTLIHVPFYVGEPQALIELSNAELALELCVRLRAMGIDPAVVGSINIPNKPGFTHETLHHYSAV